MFATYNQHVSITHCQYVSMLFFFLNLLCCVSEIWRVRLGACVNWTSHISSAWWPGMVTYETAYESIVFFFFFFNESIVNYPSASFFRLVFVSGFYNCRNRANTYIFCFIVYF